MNDSKKAGKGVHSNFIHIHKYFENATIIVYFLSLRIGQKTEKWTLVALSKQLVKKYDSKSKFLQKT